MSAKTIVYEKKLQVKKEYDVIVCGGGVAGVAAAVTAAKNGLSTLLLEKSNLLGGLGTLPIRLVGIPMIVGLFYAILSTIYLSPFFWNHINIKAITKAKTKK